MALTKGIALRAGWQREAVCYAPQWPAPAAAALTALLPLLTLQPNDGVQQAGHSDTRSGLGLLAFDLLSQTPTVTPPCVLRYQGFESLFACALGHGARRLSGVLMPQTLATGAYRHLYEVDAHLSTAQGWALGDGWLLGDGLVVGQRKVRRGTFAADMQVNVWEWLSTMVQAFTVQATPEGVTLTVELVGHSLARASVVNTAATMARLPLPVAPRLRFDQLVCRIAPYSASVALNSGDVQSINSWTLRYDGHLVTSFGPRTLGAPEEYERDGPPTITLTVVLPRHAADSWQTRWGNNQTLMADAKFTGGQIAATGQTYALNWYFPSLVVTNAQLGVAGAAVPPDTVQMQAIVPSAPAAGFPTMQGLTPLALELTSGVSTHALAA